MWDVQKHQQHTKIYQHVLSKQSVVQLQHKAS